MAELTACYALARPPPPPPHAGEACGLPPELWTAIAESLGARELASLAAASSALDAIAAPIVPGLSCSLYPHQCATVRWMLRRERAGLAGVQQNAGPAAIAPAIAPAAAAAAAAPPAPPPLATAHPLWAPAPDGEGWAHALSGARAAVPPPPPPPAPGGLLCDEPGLGKTVSALARRE